MTWSEFLEEELPNIDDHDEKRERVRKTIIICVLTALNYTLNYAKLKAVCLTL